LSESRAVKPHWYTVLGQPTLRAFLPLFKTKELEILV
jgi:hypothetical protein